MARVISGRHERSSRFSDFLIRGAFISFTVKFKDSIIFSSKKLAFRVKSGGFGSFGLLIEFLVFIN